MINKGFIMLHRELIDWEWYTDVNVCKLFVHCLLRVNYSKKKWQGIVVNKGEFITSYDKLAVETGLTVSKIRTALSKLEKTNYLKVETTTTYTKISFPKLNDFVVEVGQSQNDTPNDIPNSNEVANISQSNDNHLATTNTNNNLIKNRKKIFRDKVFSHSTFDNIILESFFDYWSELNTNKTKMRFETERFFEIEKRLKKWAANERPKMISTKVKPELLTNR
ncbi:hypothetical protein [Algibacter luteus]|uniref:hypothetical protein n=1 Tax=Algibacter luteus TaxID=1178825 RepID=UPI0025964A41|nr:hypothetical protein [Algibacter luteus]WJJ96288.1 hypothetical protein O5O44_13800 [Algibacter luteus]